LRIIFDNPRLIHLESHSASSQTDTGNIVAMSLKSFTWRIDLLKNHTKVRRTAENIVESSNSFKWLA